MKKFLQFFLVCLIANPVQAQPNQDPVQRWISQNISTSHQLFELFSLSRDKEDVDFFQMQIKKTKNVSLPQIKIEGNKFYVDGWKDPFVLTNPQSIEITYQGKKWSPDVKANLKTNLISMQKVFFEGQKKKSSRFSFWSPMAYAEESDTNGILLAAAGLVVLVMYAGAAASSPIWVPAAGVGLLLVGVSSIAKADQNDEFYSIRFCDKDDKNVTVKIEQSPSGEHKTLESQCEQSFKLANTASGVSEFKKVCDGKTIIQIFATSKEVKDGFLGGKKREWTVIRNSNPKISSPNVQIILETQAKIYEECHFDQAQSKSQQGGDSLVSKLNSWIAGRAQRGNTSGTKEHHQLSPPIQLAPR